MTSSADFILTSLLTRFQWTGLPALERLDTEVFAGETDLPGTWDIYGLSLPSGARALVLYCRETGRLEEDEDPHSWDYHNSGATWEERQAAMSVAGDIIGLANQYGIELEAGTSRLHILSPEPSPAQTTGQERDGRHPFLSDRTFYQ